MASARSLIFFTKVIKMGEFLKIIPGIFVLLSLFLFFWATFSRKNEHSSPVYVGKLVLYQLVLFSSIFADGNKI